MKKFSLQPKEMGDVQTSIYTFTTDLPLFHMAPLNTEQGTKSLLEEDHDCAEQLKCLEKLPNGAILNDRLHPKYFGINQHFPYYYGVDEKTHGALEYHTTQPIHLVYTGNASTDRLHRMEKQLMSMQGVDGWIVFEDQSENWREVYLFRPWQCVSEGKRYILPLQETNVMERKIEKNGYVWGDEEIQTLKKYVSAQKDIMLSTSIRPRGTRLKSLNNPITLFDTNRPWQQQYLNWSNGKHTRLKVKVSQTIQS